MHAPFQFHKGTIRTQRQNQPRVRQYYFNSIKVRLEHLWVGTKENPRLFQFHKGTIRTKCSIGLLLLVLYFNSIKVRLERLHIDQAEYISLFQFHKGTIRTLHFIYSKPGIQLFQFHKGTIRTLWTSSHSCEPHHFNSIKVRLELSTKSFASSSSLFH